MRKHFVIYIVTKSFIIKYYIYLWGLKGVDMNNNLRIKEIIREKGISVNQFAEMLGIERQNVYNVFTKPTFQRLEQCSELLNVPISELFEKDSTEINGYVEYKGAIYRISDLQSFQNLSDIISNNNKQVEE